MPPSERTYTLEEAQRELARRECMTNGHFWDFVYSDLSPIPKAILCDRCGITCEVVS